MDTGSRGASPEVLAPRVAGFLLLLGGMLAFVVGHFAGQSGVGHVSQPVSAVAVVVGVLALVLPWQQWDVRAQVVIALGALAVSALARAHSPGEFAPFLAMMPLPFVFIGLTQRPGTATAIAPVGALAIMVASRFSFDQATLGALVFVLPISTIAGEYIAFVQQRRARAEQRVDRVLHAVRVFARMEDERIGAEIVAQATAELLDADTVAVLLAERPRSRRYLNRAWFGHPALAEIAPLIVDAISSDRTLRAGETRFVCDPEELRSLGVPRARARAIAIMALPGRGTVPLGVVIAMWRTARRSLPDPARQAAELLSEEAGRMFQRLRDAAELTRDAETDPLTELANRRTFERALHTVQPGDALVIVDVDHFKAINDTFGHQVGDDTLRALARCFRKKARQVDCVARYGGEEFALVLPEAGVEGAQMLLERVRAAWNALDPLTSFSAGVAVHDSLRAPTETLQRADAALYVAKQSGRDRDEFAAEAEIVLP